MIIVRMNMIPVGYMAKRVSGRPNGLEADHVVDIYSVSHCVSGDFADYIRFWKHNGYWFFDAPEIIREVAAENSLDLADTSLFYYEVNELEYDVEENSWKPFEPETCFKTQVRDPEAKQLEGYDVVTFSAHTSPECSPLSCNFLASKVETNRHCLLPSFEKAKQSLEAGNFKHAEQGPYRIFAVYSVK
jgi:hypothetical protein